MPPLGTCPVGRLLRSWGWAQAAPSSQEKGLLGVTIKHEADKGALCLGWRRGVGVGVGVGGRVGPEGRPCKDRLSREAWQVRVTLPESHPGCPCPAQSCSQPAKAGPGLLGPETKAKAEQHVGQVSAGASDWASWTSLTPVHTRVTRSAAENDGGPCVPGRGPHTALVGAGQCRARSGSLVSSRQPGGGVAPRSAHPRSPRHRVREVSPATRLGTRQAGGPTGGHKSPQGPCGQPERPRGMSESLGALGRSLVRSVASPFPLWSVSGATGLLPRPAPSSVRSRRQRKAQASGQLWDSGPDPSSPPAPAPCSSLARESTSPGTKDPQSPSEPCLP